MSEEPGVLQEAHGSYIAQATHGGTATVQVYTSPPSLPDPNRQRFLVRLRTRYRDLLEQSQQEGVRLFLRLAERPRAVEAPVRVLSHSPQQPTRPLSAGTTLAQVYAHAGQELLLQGEPGAGKSTLLLELALTLVEQAALDHSQPLPVIVPLSSWASKRQPLSEWLAEQIALLYDIAPRLSQRWVREERLLPFLDGLDEMEEGARVACIEAINAYHREHLHPLVVGSRKAENEARSSSSPFR